MSYYDILVLRARYAHSITRTLPAEALSGEGRNSTGNGPKLSHQQAQPREVVEDQTKAHERFGDFNRMFADFIRRVDPIAVLAKSNHNESLKGTSIDDTDNGISLASPLESHLMLTEFKARAKMLEELYSTNHLTLMVCFYDFVIKNGLVNETGLAEFGGSDIAADVIDFLNTFTTDAILHAGGRPWGRTKEELNLRSSRMLVSDDDDQLDSSAGTDSGHSSRLRSRTVRSRKTLANEVEVAKAMRAGRRLLLNSNKLLGNNLREFLADHQVDWLSLDDVLDVLQHEMKDQAQHLQRAIAKEPVKLLPVEPVLARPQKPGELERAPWVVSESARRGSSRGGTMVAVSNPLLNVVDEDDEEDVSDDGDESMNSTE